VTYRKIAMTYRMGGLIGIVLWTAQTASLLSTPAQGETVIPNDWVIEARHCVNSSSDTAIHSRGFALAYRQWRCVNSHVYICDPIGTNADCSIAEYWTPIERDADEVRREQLRQSAVRTQQAKDAYLRNAHAVMAERLMFTGTVIMVPHGEEKSVFI